MRGTTIPLLQLPIFDQGMTLISASLGYKREGSKSERNAIDAAESGYRHGAPCDQHFPVLSVCPGFFPGHDVSTAGVLLAFPALLAVGLLTHTQRYFQLPNRFYRLDTIFMLLTFMALARLKTVESLRYCSPGEMGQAAWH